MPEDKMDPTQRAVTQLLDNADAQIRGALALVEQELSREDEYSHKNRRLADDLHAVLAVLRSYE